MWQSLLLPPHIVGKPEQGQGATAGLSWRLAVMLHNIRSREGTDHGAGRSTHLSALPRHTWVFGFFWSCSDTADFEGE